MQGDVAGLPHGVSLANYDPPPEPRHAHNHPSSSSHTRPRSARPQPPHSASEASAAHHSGPAARLFVTRPATFGAEREEEDEVVAEGPMRIPAAMQTERASDPSESPFSKGVALAPGAPRDHSAASDSAGSAGDSTGSHVHLLEVDHARPRPRPSPSTSLCTYLGHCALAEIVWTCCVDMPVFIIIVLGFELELQTNGVTAGRSSEPWWFTIAPVLVGLGLVATIVWHWKTWARVFKRGELTGAGDEHPLAYLARQRVRRYAMQAVLLLPLLLVRPEEHYIIAVHVLSAIWPAVLNRCLVATLRHTKLTAVSADLGLVFRADAMANRLRYRLLFFVYAFVTSFVIVPVLLLLLVYGLGVLVGRLIHRPTFVRQHPFVCFPCMLLSVVARFVIATLNHIPHARAHAVMHEVYGVIPVSRVLHDGDNVEAAHGAVLPSVTSYALPPDEE